MTAPPGLGLATVRAVEWAALGEPLRLVDVPRPEVEQPGDLVLDVHAAHFGAALRRAVTVGHPRIAPPRVLGSLVAGVVTAAGDDAPARPGDRVVVDPHPPCGTCDACRRGVPAVCAHTAAPRPGGLAQTVLVRTSRCAVAVVPDTLTFAEAVHAELLACVLEAADRGGVAGGSDVVVLGSGPLALLAVQVSRRRGARVTCVARRPARAAAARRHGAQAVLDDALAALDDDEVPQADVVLEMSGDPAALATAFRLAAPGARVVVFSGYPPGTTVPVPVNRLHYDGLHVVGSYHYRPGLFGRALDLLAAGDVSLEGILTHRLGLADAVRAPDVSGDPDCVSLVVEPHA
ncbi:zinc-dependent alcohol dehydrogenase [Cellulomonas biazotea]|uniref:L-idonate 5-dehydrogenase n=1 Tax=Cellulomonas biazotea TaxID=1709 RepID=A0A402DN05_9CELL|nr:zinc-binding dehydrogenase [Cellulomonas biazotea]GCE75468.1 L-idonate 5-dehydrogenase [Cellulomonas biazotea]